MSLNIKQFIQACNPSKTLVLSNDRDRPYYIDFTTARSGSSRPISLIAELYRTITFNDDPTHQLFTGHIGCGKSTELRKLQYDLEQAGFHVIYLDSSEDLVMNDVDLSDILLTIARQISKSLETSGIHLDPKGFRGLIHETWNLLQSDVDVSLKVAPPISSVKEVSINAEKGLTIDAGIAQLSAKVKGNPTARARLHQYLEPQTDNLLALINQELLTPAIQALKAQGKQGLVTIVDSLDRLENTKDKNQAEYLFDTRGEQLRRIQCHLVYTTPLLLSFSNSIAAISDRFGGVPKVLPMVSVKNRDDSLFPQGIQLLQDMILARAFQDIPTSERQAYLSQIFDTPETCDRLCSISGGHVRNLLVLLYGCLQQQDPPLDRSTLEDVITTQRDALIRTISPDEWTLLRQVKNNKAVVGEEGYQTLLRSLFVFEYRDPQGTWFGLNPILAEAPQLTD